MLVPGGFVFIAGKSGTGYVLRQGALGGVGGQVSSRSVCTAFGGAAQSGSTIYLPCTDGLRMIVIGSSGAIHLGWHTSAGPAGRPSSAGAPSGAWTSGPVNSSHCRP